MINNSINKIPLIFKVNMISRIVFGNRIINMNTPGKPKIFDVDSISLLIGINGSGKTKFLHSIIDALNTQKNKHADCEIYNELGLELNECEIKKWGVIYFSPLSFNGAINKQSNSFINITPNMVEPYENNDFKDILEIFNINTRLTAKIELNYTKILNELISTLVDTSSTQKEKNRLHYEDIPNESILSKINELVTVEKDRIKHNKKQNQDMQKLYYKNGSLLDCEKKIRAELANEILLYLMTKNEPVTIFSTLCVADLYMRDVNSSAELLFFLFFKLDFFSSTSRFKKISYSRINTREIDQTINDYSIFFKHPDGKSSPVSIFHNDASKDNSIEIDLSETVKTQITSRKHFSDLFSIRYSGMSSGQLALLEQINSISLAVKKLKGREVNKMLVLIDEGDAFLHLDWQNKYIHTMNLFFSRIKEKLNIETLQIILSTHSPILATDIPKEFICNLNEGKEKTSSSFAAPLFQLLNDSFDTQTIGKFASEKINTIIENVKNNKLSDSDIYLIKEIDNSLIKNEIKNLISKHNAQGDNNI